VLPPVQEVGGSEGLVHLFAWIQPHMTHLPEVMVAPESGAGGLAPQPGFLPPCSLASQSSATFPNGSYLSPGPLKAKWGYNEGGPSKAKGGIMRKLLDDMGRSSALMPPPFHWGPFSWTQVSGRPELQGTPEEYVVAGLVAQVLRCGGL
jgi:hypothetical protein